MNLRQFTKWTGKRSHPLILALKVIWFLSIFTGEYLGFWKASHDCAPWPKSPSWKMRPSASRQELSNNDHRQIDGTVRPYNIMIIGDPQLTDKYSYGRKGVIQWITEFYSDQYMRRNWKKLNRKLRPDAVVFLGDLMDGGREWPDDREWKEEVNRFKALFKPLDSSTKVLYMAGNHDVGFGDGIRTNIVNRFKSEFGDTSYELFLDSHSIVMIDSVSMSSTDPNIHQQPRDFVREIRPSDKPRILFTHVPLYREPSPISGAYRSEPPEDLCGPLRQSKKQIRQGAGYQYQNLMTKELSDYILTQTQADFVFSGDDHDYCEVIHKVGSRQVPEISVNTFSMAQGVRYPGVVLLSLSAAESKTESYANKLCLLPDQISIFIRYGILFGLSVLVLLCSNLLELYGLLKSGGASPTIPSYRQDINKDQQRKNRSLSQHQLHLGKILDALKRTANDIRQVAIPSIVFYLLCALVL
ncbi:Metallo-dependent phosphatase-like protein [Umbelopsis sp. AD052]|nr:Metallo-dependent phosphatase-like protein [Umbelopsis sp. AD052]